MYVKKELKVEIIEFQRETKKKSGYIKMKVPERFIDLLEDKIFGGCLCKDIIFTWKEIKNETEK